MSDKTLIGCRALLGEDAQLSDGAVDIFIYGGRVQVIHPTGQIPPVGEVIDANRSLATPGLINGHFHSHEHFHKGRYDNVALEVWMNYVRPVTPLPWTPRQVYLRTLIGAIETLRSGATTICDNMNVSPVLNPEHVEAALQAYQDIGLRAHLGITLFDKPIFRGMPFVDEEFPPEMLAELSKGEATPPADVLDFARGLARDRHPRENRVGYIAAPSAPQRCPLGAATLHDGISVRHPPNGG